MSGGPVVSIAKCASYQEAEVSAALEKLLSPWGGAARWGGKGKKVFIKPNLLLAATPGEACTTHPALLEAVIRAFQATGSEVFFGDLPGGFHVGASLKINEKCGMNLVAKNTGAELVRLEHHGFSERKIPNGRKIKIIHTPKFLDGMDVLINIPKLKTHMQSLYTGAIKNVFGFTTTGDRAHAHTFNNYSDFSSVLVDIYSAITPTFNIMDAVVGMEGTGPSQGKPVKLGMLLASEDGVALDAAASAATGFAPGEILSIVKAGKRGLGVADLSNIKIEGASIASVKKNIRRPSSFIFNMLPSVGGLFAAATRVKPVIDKNSCKKCNRCVEVCPAGAIKTSGAYRIEDDKCILCFCCHEMCPHSAVKLEKAILVKIAETFMPR